MLTSGKSSYQGGKWLRFSSVLTAASKQKYAKNKITWQLDQTNISITHIWKQDREQTLALWSLLAFAQKSGQLIPTLLFGASLFLAWLPSQINWFPVANLECSLCAMFFLSPLPNTQMPSFFPQRNKSKATLPSSTQLCTCISFYTWKWFIFVSVPLMLRHVSYFIRHQQTAEELLAWQASGWLTLKIHKLTLSQPLYLWSYSLILISPETRRSVFFHGPYHRNNGWVKTD